MSSADASTRDAVDLAHEDRVLEAALAYAEKRISGRPLVATEFGTPSLGLDNSETHFVVVEGADDRLLVRVMIFPDGLLSAVALTADLVSPRPS